MSPSKPRRKATRAAPSEVERSLEALFLPFTGFPDPNRAFLKELARRQDRDWFTQHREEYVELWHRPMEALAQALAERLRPILPEISAGRTKVFRVHRDVRFSADKTPYKNHVAAMVGAEGHGGFYVQLGVTEDFVGLGRWMMEPDVLTRMRSRIDDDSTGAPFAKAVNGLERRGFQLHSYEQLKRVPAPYPADHPRADLLKRKGLAFGFPTWPRGLERKAAFADWLIEQAKRAAPAVKLMAELTR